MHKKPSHINHLYKKPSHTKNLYQKPSHKKSSYTSNLYKKPSHTSNLHKNPSHTNNAHKNQHKTPQTNIMRINIFVVINKANKHKAKIYNHCKYTQIIIRNFYNYYKKIS